MGHKKNWQWIDWVLFSIYSALLVMEIIILFSQPEKMGNPQTLPFLLLLLTTYATPLFFWRPGYVHGGWFAFTLLFTAGIPALYYSHMNHGSIGLILLPTIIVGYLSKRRSMVWTIPVYLLVIPIAMQIVLGKLHPGDVIYRMFDYCLMYGIGFSLKRIVLSNDQMKRLLAKNQLQFELIQKQNQTLEQYAKEVERLTLYEERNRMASELHDTVGHTFTSIIMGMDAVSYLIEASPAKAKEKLDVLRQVTRSGLEEVRRSIHQMAPPDTDLTLHHQVASLAAEFGLHTETEVNVNTEGKEPELSRQAKWTLIRCLQESLTNAIRHGHAGHIVVTLRYDSAQTVLLVEDDGTGTDELVNGFGLKAMTDRVQALGGSLSVVSRRGQGTSICCTIPHIHSSKESYDGTHSTYVG